ncbi:MAG TPA: helix-turn-helix transcriptional regulator [Conexibacter sp.]|nr:helix-turn-helix transcriptional regulator [Conexibacter sp.]
MRAGTRYAVLGLLQEQPSYGYEVLVRFRRAFAAAEWDISPQGLYASLDRLERDGLIEPVATQARVASRRQPKTPYRVTPTGAEALRRFLATAMAAEPSRAELLVRLQCGAARDNGALLALLDGHERACLDQLEHIADEAPARLAGDDDALVERLAREERRLGIQARLMWIDYARKQLRQPERARQDARPREVVTS